MDKTLQEKLFDAIRLLLPSEKFLPTLSTLLGKSNDTLYRLCNGRTALKLEEAKVLVKHFTISLDELILQDNAEKIIFDFNNFPKAEPAPYLKFVAQQFRVNKSDSENPEFDRVRMTLAAKEIPSFYFFKFPELLAFRTYFYARAIWDSPVFKGIKFSFDKEQLLRSIDDSMENSPPSATKSTDKDVFQLGLNVLESYTQIHSVEIWNDNTIDGQLNQISYSWNAGFFESKESALSVLNTTEKLIKYIEKQAEIGKKTSPITNETAGKYELFHSESLPIDSTIVKYIDDEIQKSYILYNTGNYLISKNKFFSKNLETYSDRIIRQSIPISKVGEGKRIRFFKHNSNKIERVRQIINNS